MRSRTTTCAIRCLLKCRSRSRSLPPWKVEIVASDINYSALLTAGQGIYNENQMETVDYSMRLRYFDKTADRYAVKDSLKTLIQFDFHNLKTEFLPQRNDIIFCRNVMIYFDEAEQKRLVEKFYRCLNPRDICSSAMPKVFSV